MTASRHPEAYAAPHPCVAATDPFYILHTSGTTGRPKGVVRDRAGHGVRLLFTAPTALRAIRQRDPDGRLIAAHDLSRLDALYLAGDRAPATATWAAARLGVPVVDHWWRTETGWPIAAGFLGYGLFPPLPGSGGRACPGYDVAGRAAGEAACHAAYLRDTPGWYRTGDGGVVDPSGDVWVMGRTDDLINVAGHCLGTGQMEEVLASHPDVAECAVIGAADALRGQVPLGLVVLSANAVRDEAEVCAELVTLVRARTGPVAAFRDVRVLARLPGTRSGKILRASIRRLADGQDPNPPPAIDDPAALDDVRAALLRKGPHV